MDFLIMAECLWETASTGFLSGWGQWGCEAGLFWRDRSPDGHARHLPTSLAKTLGTSTQSMKHPPHGFLESFGVGSLSSANALRLTLPSADIDRQDVACRYTGSVLYPNECHGNAVSVRGGLVFPGYLGESF
ncbi:hypothetical protein AAFF_G00434750 [Aldrovandia affinis]|uniref:Uncharacterized protein n=1 Tax=Aldrovandia affinis TaxID=143900 RepID=A0AAD7S855_9TELE|nr:hypothetical protein AAFF_G00434750 [Aldrovandia affinis]